jgi:DNA-binding transcriptional regulator YiaG
MPNIGSLLKSEISRLSRKEVRTEIAALRKASSQYRSSIAALKQQVSSLERQVRRASKTTAPVESDEDGVRHRFQAKGLVTHRKKIGLSAADYGRLVGVSGQTIYKWEDGKSHPRASQLQLLAAVRLIGKREAAKRLEQLAAA